jgi:hypothetical protein
MKFKYLLLSVAIGLFSCHKTDKITLVGEWQYEKTGYKSSKGIQWEDQNVSKGYKVIFSKDSITAYNNGLWEYTATYKLINNGEYIVIGSPDPQEIDTLKISELTIKTLQIESQKTAISMRLARVR